MNLAAIVEAHPAGTPALAAGDEVGDVAVVGERRARRGWDGHKCPTSLLIVDAIPRGLAGKLLRRTLRSP